jgi:hypothetical protein
MTSVGGAAFDSYELVAWELWIEEVMRKSQRAELSRDILR